MSNLKKVGILIRHEDISRKLRTLITKGLYTSTKIPNEYKYFKKNKFLKLTRLQRNIEND